MLRRFAPLLILLGPAWALPSPSASPGPPYFCAAGRTAAGLEPYATAVTVTNAAGDSHTIEYRRDPTNGFALGHTIDLSAGGSFDQDWSWNDRLQLATLSEGDLAVSHEWYPGTDILRYQRLHRGGVLLHERERVVDLVRGRLTGLVHRDGLGNTLSSRTFTHHPGTDRVHAVTRGNGDTWTFEYNDPHHDLTDAEYRGARGHLRFRYEYDSIGNRVGEELLGIPGSRVTFGVDDANMRVAMDSLGHILFTGTYAGGVTNLRLRVNGDPVVLQGTNWYHRLAVATNSLPTNVAVRLSAAWEDAAGQDCASVVTGVVHVPAAAPVLAYRGNGELLGDGRNRYVWDGHGHLREVLQTNQPSWHKESYDYDARSRRIRRRVWSNAAKDPLAGWQLEAVHHYVHKGWNLGQDQQRRS